MRRAVVVASGALVCFAVAGLGPARAAMADEKGAAVSSAPDLSGRWQLNKELSDDAHEKMRQPTGRQRGGYGPGPGMLGPGSGSGRLGLPPSGGGDDDSDESLHAILDPAEELSIFQGQPDIVLDEKFVRRRTLHADARKYKAENGAAEVKAEWKEGRLVIETRGFRGRKTTETWERNASGKRLTALVKLATGNGPTVTIKRVYDRVGEAAPVAPPATP
jgi:hypothetical protein